MARRSWKSEEKNDRQSNWEKKLRNQMPWVDIIIETKDFHKLPEIFGIEKNLYSNLNEYFEIPIKYNNNFQAFLPISTGCDHFCTFCIVPYARGSEICRDYRSIKIEFDRLIDSGCKDITFLGQTVNRWINPKYEKDFQKKTAATYIPGLNEKLLENINSEPKDFLQLLQLIDKIEGEWWFNFMSSHPNYITEPLIDFLSKSTHFRPYIHLALQSGSDRILKRMNRRHVVAEFVEKVDYMRRKIPGIAISTDIIVGFPGETQVDFLQTAEIMKNLEFDMAFIAEFSSRSGTAASILKDDVPHIEKARRKTFLNDEILAKTALIQNNKMLNQVEIVLVNKINSKKQIFARTGNMKEVLLTNTNDKKLIGTFQKVKITRVTPWAMEGRLEA
jgi:tRNA-2-methylthio-N6-dimethylallyladenosine synthase